MVRQRARRGGVLVGEQLFRQGAVPRLPEPLGKFLAGLEWGKAWVSLGIEGAGQDSQLKGPR